MISNVVFKDVAPADARRAMQSKEVSALLLVAPRPKSICRS